jgi:hypothetical protein
MSAEIGTAVGPARTRDLRLDFFRGLAMFIILVAHIPDDRWALWIPARFGFSDATEIFVFCSGMASGIAFGAVFVRRGWFLGAARIAFRVWQVYWAHVGVFLASVLLAVLLDRTGAGEPGRVYAEWPPIARFFTDTGAAVVGLFTLGYVPGLFDILPMYLVILAMVPVVMAAHRVGGRMAVFALVALTWLAANLAAYARSVEDEAALSAVQRAAAWAGDRLSWMNLPGSPWNDGFTWFFNPFGWQLVFFTGFCFAMGWLPKPPVRRWPVVLAAAILLTALPFAWHKIYQYDTGYLPETLGGAFFWDARGAVEPLYWKTWVGAWRYLHFLALAYLAWAAVGPDGVRLEKGWQPRARAPATRRAARIGAAAVLLVTLPYTYIPEIRLIAPALDGWFVANIPLVDARWIGLIMLVHLAALIFFAWHSIGDRARRWLVGDAFLAAVPVIRKVGTQSLAVFMTSLVLARFLGWWMDVMSASVADAGWRYVVPRDVWLHAIINLSGFAVLIGVAYTVGWFKAQPWRERPPARRAADEQRGKTPAGTTRPMAAE